MYALVTYGLGSEFLLLDSYHAKNSFPDSMKIFGVLAVVNRGVIKSHITLGRHSHTKFTEPFNLEFKILSLRNQQTNVSKSPNSIFFTDKYEPVDHINNW